MSTTLEYRRAGWTLLEVLVVLFIIGLLMAVLLPAIQLARSAALRARCGVNLRQIGLAIHQYTAGHERLPAGTTFNEFSAHSTLLPYLEQNELYSHVNFSVGATDFANRTVFALRIDTFVCPADVPPPAPALLSYPMCSGRGVLWFGKDGYDGSFSGHPEWFRWADVTDGMAQTAAVSEWLLGGISGSHEGNTFPIAKPKLDPGVQGNLNLFMERCRTVDRSRDGIARGSWIDGQLLSSLYNHLLGPNENSCSNDGTVAWGAITAGSRHGDGVHVLFLDGHVDFIPSDVELSLWRASATRSTHDAGL